MSLLLSDFWLIFVIDVGILALAAVGLYVCFIAGQYSLGHAGLLGAGAYAAGYVATETGYPFWVGIGFGILVGALLGLAIGSILRRLREFYLAIGTLALNLAFIVLLNNTPSLGGALGMFGIRLRTTANMTILALIAVSVGVVWLERTRLGRAMRAMHDDETMAAANGVRILRVKLVVWTISGAITGLAGGLQAHFLGIARPVDYGMALSTELWVPLFVGGTHIVLGPVVGTFLVGLVPEIINRQIQIDPIMIAGVLLIIIMLVRPNGLIQRGTIRGIRSTVKRMRPYNLRRSPVDTVEPTATTPPDVEVAQAAPTDDRKIPHESSVPADLEQ